MAKKNRSDSVFETTRLYGLDYPEPPAHVHLRDCDRPYFDSILHARPVDSWNDTDLELAAILARCKADADRLHKELDSEGFTVVGLHVDAVPNPKFRLFDLLIGRTIALSRLLHVHAAATCGRPEQSAKRLQAQNKLHNIRDNAGGLIPH